MRAGSGPRNSPPGSIERPAKGAPSNRVWGSDAVAAVLRAIELPYVALNPGASFRGLHDSLVNYLGNERPQLLLCLHEEAAVAIAHGYAKITGRPMGAVVHSNVGLMHATMAVFNAWCDRMPLVLLGATGPVDAARRRPWIDWIHSARDQGALVRAYVKWDDQPASVAAAQESILRANLIARTAPRGPVFVNLDRSLQEEALDGLPGAPEMARFAPPAPPHPPEASVRAAARLLVDAKRPVMLVGRSSRSEEAWRQRIALAEALGAQVATDYKTGAVFPTEHPLHAAGPSCLVLHPAVLKLAAEADAILSLDWIDLAGTLRTAYRDKPVAAKIVQVSADQYVHNGWSLDHQGLPPVDIALLAEPEIAVPALLAAVRALRPTAPALPARAEKERPPPVAALARAEAIDVPLLATALRAVLAKDKPCLTRVPYSWAPQLWEFAHPLDFIGDDGGAGVGSGPGISVGAALALKGTDRMAVAITGDGDFLMGATALWTAAHYGIPLLIAVANNRSFYNDELHQERVAKERGRPVENRWIGQHIRDPDIDLAGIARAQGCVGIGPVEDPKKLVAALGEAAAAVRAGRVAVVDVRVAAGYDPVASADYLKRD